MSADYLTHPINIRKKNTAVFSIHDFINLCILINHVFFFSKCTKIKKTSIYNIHLNKQTGIKVVVV